MARYRTIKPEFFTSEQVMELSHGARLAFIALWVFGDDGGVHPANPKMLKAEAFPADDVSSEDVRRMVAELLDLGLVERYSCDGVDYWFVPGFERNQKIEYPSYRWPNRDGFVPENIRPKRDSQNVRRTKGERSPNAPGKERKKEPRALLPKEEPIGNGTGSRDGAPRPSRRPIIPEGELPPVGLDIPGKRRAS